MRTIILAMASSALLAMSGCRSDAPGTGPKAAPSTSAAAAGSAARRLDTTPLPGAPTPASIAGWWVVEAGFVTPNDDPGARPGSAWFFGPDSARLVFGDAHDKRPIRKTTAEGDALRLEVEGSALLLTRRAHGLAVTMEGETIRIPLRAATPGEVQRLDAIDKKRAKMLDRACEKALQCCLAARAKHVAKDNDCQPLTSTTDLETCIAAVALYKRKAAEAQVVVPECLPDK